MLSTKINSERQEDNTMKVLLKTYNLSLCLNREYLKSMLSKNIIKESQKLDTFSLFIKIEQELTWE
jgi:hypothetical protein